MKPITFLGFNAQIAKEQEEYQTLPACIIPPQEEGGLTTTVSCWKPTFKERIQILLGMPIWHMHLYRGNYPPMFLSTNRDEVMTLPKGFKQDKEFPI